MAAAACRMAVRVEIEEGDNEDEDNKGAMADRIVRAGTINERSTGSPSLRLGCDCITVEYRIKIECIGDGKLNDPGYR